MPHLPKLRNLADTSVFTRRKLGSMKTTSIPTQHSLPEAKTTRLSPWPSLPHPGGKVGATRRSLANLATTIGPARS